MGENERIRQIRVMRNLTQTEFGDAIGIKTSSVSEIERGKNAVTQQVRKSVCREFGVSEEWLQTGNGDMYAPEPEDELSALAKRYGLTVKQRIVVEHFLQLKPDTLEDIVTMIERVAADFAKENNAPMTNEEIEAEVEAYRKELYAEKRVRDSLPPMNDGNRRGNDSQGFVPDIGRSGSGGVA